MNGRRGARLLSSQEDRMARQTPAQPRLPTPPGWFMRPWVRRRRLTRRGRLRAPSIAANRGAAGTQGYRSGASLAAARGRLSRKFGRAGEAEVIFRALVETALKSQQEKRPTPRGRGRDTPEHEPDRQTAALRSVWVGTTVRRCLCVAATGGWAVRRKTWSVIETALPRLFELRSFSLVGIALVPPKG